MKLAEALSIRKDLQKRIQQLEQRIKSNVKVQEDEEPLEDPNERRNSRKHTYGWHFHPVDYESPMPSFSVFREWRESSKSWK